MKRWLLIVALFGGLLMRGYFTTQAYAGDFITWWLTYLRHASGGMFFEFSFPYGHVFDRICFAAGWWSELIADGARVGILFRAMLTGVLSLADLGIAGLLLHRFGVKAAIVFWLSPVSALITCCHVQYDTAAICVGLLAVIWYERGWKRAGLLMVGLSLAIKHDLFLFPLWLAMRENDWKDRLACLLLPGVVFLASFFPHGEGIYTTIMYGSTMRSPLLGWTGHASVIYVAILCIAGFALRHKPVAWTLPVYLLLVFLFTPAIATQYWAVPGLAVAVFFDLGYAAYLACATLFLLPMYLQHDELWTWLPTFFWDGSCRWDYEVECGLHQRMFLVLLGASLLRMAKSRRRAR